MEHRAEVNIMCLTEYDEAETMNRLKESYKKAGKEEGLKEGLEQGLEQGLKEGEAERQRLEAIIADLQKRIEVLEARK